MHFCDHRQPRISCPLGLTKDALPAHTTPVPEGVFYVGLQCDIVLAETDWDAGACRACGLVLGPSRSFSRPLNLLPRGWRPLGELVLFFQPAGEGSLDCCSFRRFSVSRSRASRAWSSWVCEFTASFLRLSAIFAGGVGTFWVLGQLAYFCWTDCTKPSRLLSMANASFRAAEKLVAIILAALSKGPRALT